MAQSTMHIYEKIIFVRSVGTLFDITSILLNEWVGKKLGSIQGVQQACEGENGKNSI